MQCAAVVQGILTVSSQPAPRERRMRSSIPRAGGILKGVDCNADSGILNMGRVRQGSYKAFRPGRIFKWNVILKKWSAILRPFPWQTLGSRIIR